MRPPAPPPPVRPESRYRSPSSHRLHRLSRLATRAPPCFAAAAASDEESRPQHQRRREENRRIEPEDVLLPRVLDGRVLLSGDLTDDQVVAQEPLGAVEREVGVAGVL